MPTIGLIKTIGVNYDIKKDSFTNELETSVRDFFKERGINETKRNKGIKYKFIDYDADEMTVSWNRLQADMEDAFPSLKLQYTEGVDDEEDYNGRYENLEVSN